MTKLHRNPQPSQPPDPDHPDDELSATYFLAGVLGRTLDEIGPEHIYLDRRRAQWTRGQAHELRTVAALQLKLRRIEKSFMEASIAA